MSKRASVKKVIERSGWIEIRGGGKGSHQKFRCKGRRPIILPIGKDVSRGVLRTTAEALGISVQTLEEQLRKV